jgi:cytochrome c-type biogenesis protein CcmH/NrfG
VRNVLATKPELAEAHARLARALAAQGRHDEATVSSRRARELSAR